MARTAVTGWIEKNYLKTTKDHNMHRIPPTSRVRRRLFSEDDVTHQARIDNFANVLQESVERTRVEKTNKWNFDFENEVPLEGTYEWFPCGARNDWVGKPKTETTAEIDDADEEMMMLRMKDENEITPKACKEDENVPIVKKRKQDDLEKEVTDKGVRRKISFD